MELFLKLGDVKFYPMFVSVCFDGFLYSKVYLQFVKFIIFQRFNFLIING